MARKTAALAATRKEALAIKAHLYESTKPCKYGHGVIRVTSSGACYECRRILMQDYHRRDYLLHKNEYKRNARKWVSANPVARAKVTATYRDKNREQLKAYNRAWFKANPKRRAHHEGKRRASKVQAALVGYEAELRAIYDACPAGHHVDHIVPLKHPKVCGLHVPWNLQYLPGSDNCKKSNKFVESLAIAPAFESHTRQ